MGSHPEQEGLFMKEVRKILTSPLIFIKIHPYRCWKCVWTAPRLFNGLGLKKPVSQEPPPPLHVSTDDKFTNVRRTAVVLFYSSSLHVGCVGQLLYWMVTSFFLLSGCVFWSMWVFGKEGSPTVLFGKCVCCVCNPNRFLVSQSKIRFCSFSGI